MMFRFVWLLVVLIGLSACTDNNSAQDMSEDMISDMSGEDMQQDMSSERACMKDNQSYKHDEEVCLARQSFKCDDGSLIDLKTECGDPFDVDIRIVDLKGMATKVGGIDVVAVRGKLENQGTKEALNVQCTYYFTLEGEQREKISNIQAPRMEALMAFNIEVDKDSGDIGKGKTATFEYECTADNEDEEAKSIGNYKKITFTY